MTQLAETERGEDYVSMFRGVDPVKIEAETASILQLPQKPVLLRQDNRIVKAPLILAGPFTAAAKEMAFQEGMDELSARFLRNSMLHRNYQPEDVLNRVKSEVVGWARFLTEPTKNALKVFFRTEAGVSEFTEAGLSTVKGGTGHSGIVTRWGFEEWRHFKLLHDGMILSGVVSKPEARALTYEYDLPENKWKPGNHPGLKREFGFIWYGAAQEKETTKNYLDWLMIMVRNDYGLIIHDQMTPAQVERALCYQDIEKRRGYKIGLSGLIEPIPPDEEAHGGMYVEVGKLLLRYKTEQAVDALEEVQAGFVMPLTRSRETIKLVRDLYGKGAREKINARQADIWKKIDRVWGFDDLQAVINAGEQAYTLKELLAMPGVAFMKPDGSFEALQEYVSSLPDPVSPLLI